QAATGEGYTIGLTSAGKVIAWGSQFNANQPIELGLENIVLIVSGGSHIIAKNSSNTLLSLGNNQYSQRGCGSCSSSWEVIPVTITSQMEGKTIDAISGGNGFTLAASDTGLVFGWGTNDKSQLGNPSVSSAT